MVSYDKLSGLIGCWYTWVILSIPFNSASSLDLSSYQVVYYCNYFYCCRRALLCLPRAYMHPIFNATLVALLQFSVPQRDTLFCMKDILKVFFRCGTTRFAIEVLVEIGVGKTHQTAWRFWGYLTILESTWCWLNASLLLSPCSQPPNTKVPTGKEIFHREKFMWPTPMCILWWMALVWAIRGIVVCEIVDCLKVMTHSKPWLGNISSLLLFMWRSSRTPFPLLSHNWSRHKMASPLRPHPTESRCPPSYNPVTAGSSTVRKFV